MEIKIEITPRQIADLMVSAVEGNHMTRAWCEGIYLKGAWEKKTHELNSPWYDDEKLYAGEFTVEIVEVIDEGKAARGNNLRRHRRNQVDFAKAIATMAKNNPSHFGDWLAENHDAVTADVFLQHVALGKVIYG